MHSAFWLFMLWFMSFKAKQLAENTVISTYHDGLICTRKLNHILLYMIVVIRYGTALVLPSLLIN